MAFFVIVGLVFLEMIIKYIYFFAIRKKKLFILGVVHSPNETYFCLKDLSCALKCFKMYIEGTRNHTHKKTDVCACPRLNRNIKLTKNM